MTLDKLLRKEPDYILLHATDSLIRSNLEHYIKLKPENVRARLANLYFKLRECVEQNDDQPMINFIHSVGEERFEAGFYLHEVQAAINILEESLWFHIVREVDLKDHSEALERIQGLLCIAKRELARTYISLSKNETKNVQAG